MHSSTFSSNRECPEGPWLKTWLLTIALALTVLAGWELALRRLGHRPTVVDDEVLWAGQRDRVYADCCERAVVLLGDCRVQLGLVPQVLRDRLPRHRVVQLAVHETSPIAALRDLAADERFNGIVICGVNARLLCKDMWDMQQPYIDYYHTQYGLNDRLNRSLSALAQRRLVIIHPQLRLDDIAVNLVKEHKLPAPYYLQTLADRSRLADYSHVDLEAHRLWALGRANWLYTGSLLPAPPKWLLEALELEEWVKAIQARGGRVVFVQLPTTGQHWRYDEWTFPKARYWDAFAAQTSALCIHFRDVPQLAAFDCPDTSHLDRTDAPRFTLEFAKVLEERGLFGTPPCASTSGQIAGQTTKCLCRRKCSDQSGSARCPCCATHASRHNTQRKTASKSS